jgi:V8-like Glu-specific endopeptidase
VPVRSPRTRHPGRILAAVAAGLVACSVAGSAGGAVAAPVGTPRAVAFVGQAPVGALFSAGASKHFCTATVVDSPAGDVVITAAHCVVGRGRGLVFAPGYYNGIAPYGRWKVVAAYGAPGWLDGRSAQRDYAFLVVGRNWIGGRLTPVQSVTGGVGLGLDVAAGQRVTVPAYEAGENDLPVTCSNRLVLDGPFPRFDCNQYLDGTSGAPFLATVAGGGLVVVGVIGGPNQGGCEPWSSYSSPFGPALLRAYRAAVAAGPSDRFPVAGSDGCTTGL